MNDRKLTDEQVREIRWLRTKGLSIGQITKIIRDKDTNPDPRLGPKPYNSKVSQDDVYAVISNRSYRDVK